MSETREEAKVERGGTAPERWLARVPEESGMIRDELLGLHAGHDPDGGRWVMATNGHIAIAERGVREVTSNRDISAPLRIEGSAIGEYSGADLLMWAGMPEYPRVSPCRECDGHGRREHSCNCELCQETREDCPGCDGKGRRWDWDERHGTVLGFRFNRNYVAMVVDAIGPASTFRVSVCPTYRNDARCLRLDAGDRFGLVMGLGNPMGEPGPEFVSALPATPES
jgi:hypothetical protein